MSATAYVSFVRIRAGFLIYYKSRVRIIILFNLVSLLLDQRATPAAILRILFQVGLVLVAVDVKLMLLALPLVGDPGDGHDADLVTLADDLLIGEGVRVVAHQLQRGVLDVVVVDVLKCFDAGRLFLERDLSRYVPDEVARQIELFHDVLERVNLPRDGELNVAPDLTLAVAHGAVDFSLGIALLAVGLTVTVFGMVAIKASFSHTYKTQNELYTAFMRSLALTS